MGKRDLRYDVMKGIGILLMMLGHIPVEGMVYKWIYSFHMPMFFLISGYLTKNTAMFAGGGGYSRLPEIISTTFSAVRSDNRMYHNNASWNTNSTR